MISSWTPSEKYSFSGSAVMFSNGSTATKRSASAVANNDVRPASAIAGDRLNVATTGRAVRTD